MAFSDKVNNKLKENARKKALAERMVAAGLCRSCHKPRNLYKTFCDHHHVQRRNNERVRRRRKPEDHVDEKVQSLPAQICPDRA